MEKDTRIFDYLFLGKNAPFKNKWFNSFIIKTNSYGEYDNIIDIFKELFVNCLFVNNDDELIVIYFQDIDFNIKDVIASLAEDFSINILYLSFPKLFTKENMFSKWYELYNRCLSKRKQGYYETSDLILEIIENKLMDIDDVKKIVLGKILNDPQNEILIKAMFENNLNVIKTSTSIYMHRNTLSRKINVIKETTGLNLRNFQDAVVMYVLMRTK